MQLYYYTLRRNRFAIFHGIITELPAGFLPCKDGIPIGDIYYKMVNKDMIDIICVIEADEATCHSSVRTFIDRLTKFDLK